MHVLLADDDDITRAMQERALARLGLQVTVCGNGEEAWARLSRADPPQIAVLDWMMPGLDGPEICRRLRKMVGGSYIYVILLTAKRDTQDIVTGLDAGADDYIVKPCHPDELAARVRAGRRIVELERDLLSARELLRRQASHDSLTDLLNRRGIQDRLGQEARRCARERRPLGVVLADLDHFKSINDRYGHAAGDQVLQEAAQRMNSAVREYDAVGRYGGEEFLLIGPGCGVEETRALAERVRQRIAATPFSTLDGDVLVTASFGVSAYLGAGNPDRDALLRAADAALYRAKAAGRNRVELGSTSKPSAA